MRIIKNDKLIWNHLVVLVPNIGRYGYVKGDSLSLVHCLQCNDTCIRCNKNGFTTGVLINELGLVDFYHSELINGTGKIAFYLRDHYDERIVLEYNNGSLEAVQIIPFELFFQQWDSVRRSNLNIR